MCSGVADQRFDEPGDHSGELFIGRSLPIDIGHYETGVVTENENRDGARIEVVTHEVSGLSDKDHFLHAIDEIQALATPE